MELRWERTTQKTKERQKYTDRVMSGTKTSYEEREAGRALCRGVTGAREGLS